MGPSGPPTGPSSTNQPQIASEKRGRGRPKKEPGGSSSSTASLASKKAEEALDLLESGVEQSFRLPKSNTAPPAAHSRCALLLEGGCGGGQKGARTRDLRLLTATTLSDAAHCVPVDVSQFQIDNAAKDNELFTCRACLMFIAAVKKEVRYFIINYVMLLKINRTPVIDSARVDPRPQEPQEGRHQRQGQESDRRL